MRRVLVPLDGSPLAESVLPDAQRLAGRGGQLILLHDVTGTESQERSEDYLERLAESLRSPDLSVATRTLAGGDPAVAIDVGAQAYGADMIALATHARSQAERTWWGSVAWRAVLRSALPALLRHAGQEMPDVKAGERRIMVPLDGSDLAEKALPLARDLMREWSAGLWLVRVVSRESGDQQEARQYLERVAREAENGVHAEVLAGEPVDTLAGAVGGLRITDVVMTSHGRTGVSRAIVGEVADDLIQRLHCPVVVVPSLFT